MRALLKPIDKVEDVFALCISPVTDAGLKARLESIVPAIKAATAEFDEAATLGELHKLPPTGGVGVVTTDEMTAVYRDRMAKKGRPGRAAYDRLMAMPARGQCPLCAQRVVSTLDHHLPKRKFPALAVTPTNLIAACADCNKAKLEHHPTEAAEQTLHPYFDDLGAHRWLYAVVEDTKPPALCFVVKPPSTWPLDLASRANHHFDLLGLDELYAAHAAQELVQIRHQLASIFDDGGEDAVRAHLDEVAASRRAAHANSWQSAAYEALAGSAWFCGGGFATIPVETEVAHEVAHPNARRPESGRAKGAGEAAL